MIDICRKKLIQCEPLPAHGNVHPLRQTQMKKTTITTKRTENSTASTATATIFWSAFVSWPSSNIASETRPLFSD